MFLVSPLLLWLVLLLLSMVWAFHHIGSTLSRGSSPGLDIRCSILRFGMLIDLVTGGFILLFDSMPCSQRSGCHDPTFSQQRSTPPWARTCAEITESGISGRKSLHM